MTRESGKRRESNPHTLARGKEAGGITVDGITVLNLFELVHRGSQISEALTARSAMRRRRRGNLIKRRCRCEQYTLALFNALK